MMHVQHPGFRLLLLSACVCVAFFLGSCAFFAEAMGITARGMGEEGYMDQEKAEAIGQSSDEVIRTENEEFTEEQEYYIGRAVGANILTRYPIDASQPDVTEYLNRVAAALAANAPVGNVPRSEPFNGYHVALLDSPEINAFATPGGHIFVSRGLLLCANSEDALAAVIAHEIAHIHLHHSIDVIRENRQKEAQKKFGSSMAAAVVPDSLAELTALFDESIDGLVSVMMSGYSQSQEYDADTLALSLLTSAGYTPSSMLDMLSALDEKLPHQPGGFNTTHPAPKNRIANINRSLRLYSAPDTRSYRKARFDGLM
jgi:predicted Zn-dependent protease